MTGQSFDAQIKALDLKKAEVAKILGIDPDTVTARCKDAEVPALYEFAIKGLAAERVFEQIRQIFPSVCQIEENYDYS
jgi:hypothetical protein